MIMNQRNKFQTLGAVLRIKIKGNNWNSMHITCQGTPRKVYEMNTSRPYRMTVRPRRPFQSVSTGILHKVCDIHSRFDGIVCIPVCVCARARESCTKSR